MAVASNNQLLIDIRARDFASPDLNKVEARVKRFALVLKGPLSDGGLSGIGKTQRQRVDELRSLSDAQRVAADGFARIGGEAVGALGPAAPAIRDVAAELAALGGGLDALIGKFGLSRGALLALGAGAAGVGALAASLGIAAAEAARLEKSISGAVVAAAGLKIAPEDFKSASRDISVEFGIPDEEVGAAITLAFENGARSIAEATERVRVAARALKDAGLDSSLPGAFDALKGSTDAFGVSLESSIRFLNLVKVAAREAETSPARLLAVTQNSAVAMRELGFSARDAFEFVARSAGQGGASVEQAGRGLDEIIRTLTSPSDPGFKILEAFGIQLDRESVRAKGFLGIIDEIRAKVGSDPADLSRVFSSRNVGAIAAGLPRSGAGLRDSLDLAENGTAALDAAAVDRAALATDRLAKATAQWSVAASQFGDDALGVWAQIVEAASSTLDALNSASPFEAGQRARRAIADSFASDEQIAAARAIAEAEADRLDLAERISREIAEQEKALARLGTLREYVDARRANPFTAPSAESGLPSELRDGGLDRSIEDAQDRLAAMRGDMEELRQFRLAVEFDAEVGMRAALAGARAAAIASFRSSPVEVPLSADTRALLDSVNAVLANIADRQIPLKIAGPVDRLRAAADDPRRLNFETGGGAISRDLADVAAYTSALEQADDLLASLRERGLTGADRQIADTERLIRQTEKLIEALRRQGVEEKVLADIQAEIPVLRAGAARDAEAAKTRETAEASARILALKVQLIDRERDLAAAAGVTADSERLASLAASERARLARENVEATIASRRAQIDPGNADALKALDEERILLLRLADAESAAAAAARDRARIDRSQRTFDLVSDAESGLLTGLDAELDAIERNRAAKIRSAQDGVRAGQLDADALARLLPLYDKIAARDAERAQRAAQLRGAEDIAGLVRDAADGFGEQAGAIRALRDVERARYADSLRDEGLLRAEIEKRLALFDRITEKQDRDALIGFALTPATQLAEQERLIAAYQRLQDAGVTAYDKIAEGIARAQSGQEALLDGFAAGIEDLRRELGNDFAFGAGAARDLGGGFRDSLSGAFRGEREDGESVGQTFLRKNLENVQKVASDFAANKITGLLLGPILGNDVAAPQTPEERMLVAVDRFAVAVDRFAGLQPGSGALDPVRTGNDSFFGEPAFDAPIGPEPPPGFDLAPSTEDAFAAADAFSDTIQKGANAASASIVSGGDAFGAGITGVLGGIASQLSSLLTGSITGFLGFAEGGIVQGNLKPYTPHRAQFGRVVRQRTLIEVAENPGLEEAIIPLRGGAVPVTIDRREDPNFVRSRERESRREREANAELARAFRGRDDERERRSRAGSESRSVSISVGAPSITVAVAVEGGSGDRGEDILRAMPQIERRLAVAIRDMTNRELVNAIRGAVG